MYGFIYLWVKFILLNKIIKKNYIYDRRVSEFYLWINKVMYVLIIWRMMYNDFMKKYNIIKLYYL